ncbi:MAG TPA: hypothetical protein VI653_23410 [Steroidobacteraceae bacterium]
MPLANLSERFYQKFGHDLVEELVTWLNQMDTAYRTDLRELNELNFARFDAKLEQRVAQLDAKLDQRVVELRAELRQEVAVLREAIANQRAELIKWMFVFWVGNVATLGGLMFALFKHFRP